MRKERKRRTRIIIGLVSVLLLMTVGYASFQTNLKITGTSSINNSWNIEIIDVSEGTSINGGENASAPTHTTLSASMEANLYEKGDAVEYDITVKNKGTVDARLIDITNNISSNNDAIKISFSNYTKGEVLEKNSTKVIKAKIEYDPNYEGEIDRETSTEVSITLNFQQAKGGGNIPAPNTYLLTYNCTENYGQDCSDYDEYLYEGETVDLTKSKPNKYGLEFLGWNTDKNANEGLNQYIMGNENKTIYAIYKEDRITINSINTTSATNSITVVVSAEADSGIKKYAYSKDNGTTWQESEENTYTFTELAENLSFPIVVKIISNTNKEITQKIEDNSCNYSAGKVWNFPYTGSAQTFPVECSGTYTFEAWGAQGGNSGGKGAYTKGEIKLIKNEALYAYVGQAGSANPAGHAQETAGGYNGGGATAGQDCCNRIFGSGGGATDFRLKNGTWNNFDSLKSRIMVAAGGGGRFSSGDGNGIGGYGGALVGGSGAGDHGGWCYGEGGTQTSAGEIGISNEDNCKLESAVGYTDAGTITGGFGYGGRHGSQGNNGTGGGGGYYGGGSSGHIASAGGGSSFISGYTGCDAILDSRVAENSGQSIHYSGMKFTNATMKAGNESMPNPSGGNETGHAGNGYARVSLKTIDKNVLTKKISQPTYTENPNGTVVINYPQGCNDNYICKYSKDGGSEVIVTSNPTLTFTGAGTIVASVSDKSQNSIVNTVNSSYVVQAAQCYVGNIWRYSFASRSQTFNTPCTGIYKIEAWGAQGGNTSATGGKGAYTSGLIRLSKNKQLFIHTGGQGASSPAGKAQSVAGGYNGGGQTGGQDCCNRSFGSGGGATDIRLEETAWNNTLGLRSRIMVAAGGGGSYSGNNDVTAVNNGGYGGDLIGGNGTQSGSQTNTYCYGEGGTQTKGGSITTNCYHQYTGTASFGQGTGVAGAGTGGGGGYYGGARSGHIASAGGGSSFISGYYGCDAIVSASSTSHTGQSIHYSGMKFTNSTMKTGNESMPNTSGSGDETGHSGNGYVKITLVSIP